METLRLAKNTLILRGIVVPLAPGMTLRQFTRAAERAYWHHQIRHTHGNVTRATKLADVSSQLGYRQMKSYGICARDFRPNYHQR